MFGFFGFWTLSPEMSTHMLVAGYKLRNNYKHVNIAHNVKRKSINANQARYKKKSKK